MMERIKGMNRLNLKLLIVSVAISFSFCHVFDCLAADEKTETTETKEAEKKETESPKAAASGEKKDSLMERIDFGNSYILGQSIKSGAVYLLHRKKSDIKSMLKTRENYRKEILEDFKTTDDN